MSKCPHTHAVYDVKLRLDFDKVALVFGVARRYQPVDVAADLDFLIVVMGHVWNSNRILSEP